MLKTDPRNQISHTFFILQCCENNGQIMGVGADCEASEKPILEIELPKNNKGQRVNATNVVWLNLNEAIFVTFDNGWYVCNVPRL